jgi:hypothetical protein
MNTCCEIVQLGKQSALTEDQHGLV